MFGILKRTGPRTIFIGDVHGCLDELRRIVRRFRLSSEDRVIMLGDLINRGPDPAGCVAFVSDRGFECLIGNHEDEYLSEHASIEKYAVLRDELGDSLHAWIEERPLWIEDSAFLCVHAGLRPGAPLSVKDRRYLLNIRTWDGIGKDIKSVTNPAWYEFYKEERPVFYGHWAQRGLNLRRTTFGLDTGCCYGRSLSAYILEEKTLIQEPARRTYYTPPALRKPSPQPQGEASA